MPRIELYSHPECADACILATWLRAEGHAPLWRNLADPSVAEELRSRVRFGIAPATLLDGRPVWGESTAQLQCLDRMLRRKSWTFPW